MPEVTPDTLLRQLPGYVLRRAAHAMMAVLAERLAPTGLRITDATVIFVIGERQDMTSSEIGRILDIQRANMAPLLNRLEATALIERNAIDRKSQAIVLTQAGLELLETIRTIFDRHEQELLDRIAVADRSHFLPALHALIADER